MPRLRSITLSTFFLDQTVLERFLMQTLSEQIEYVELSSVHLTEDLISKCTDKFKQVVVFGSPDLPHNKRQQLLHKYFI